jgi:hypothetical protein
MQDKTHATLYLISSSIHVQHRGCDPKSKVGLAEQGISKRKKKLKKKGEQSKLLPDEACKRETEIGSAEEADGDEAKGKTLWYDFVIRIFGI